MKGQSAAAAMLDRVDTTDEIAKAPPFLASDDSSQVTGVELLGDGSHRESLKHLKAIR